MLYLTWSNAFFNAVKSPNVLLLYAVKNYKPHYCLYFCHEKIALKCYGKMLYFCCIRIFIAWMYL